VGCGALAPELSPGRARGVGLASRLQELDATYHPLRTFAWALLLGVVAGIVGAIFRLAVAAAQHELAAFYDFVAGVGTAPWLVPAAVSAVLAWLAVYLVRRFAPEGSGSGVQEIEGALEGVRPLNWQRLIPVKFMGGLCSLGGSLVLGREGPTIQLGGNSGKMIADLLRVPPHVARTLVAAGAGAGLTTAFNAPLAGILFVMEEMRPQFEYTFVSVQAVVISCAVADIVVRALTGQGPVLPITDFPSPALGMLWMFPLLGSLFGVLGVVFNRALVGTLDAFAALTGWRRQLAVLAVGALVGTLLWFHPDAVGGGDDLIPRLFTDNMLPGALALLFLVRFAATMLSYGCGAPGGIFAPMLALGTLLGLWCGHYAHAWFPEQATHPGILAVAGMGALFTATVRAPITGIALAVELTADYQQILPLLLTCTTATIVAESLGGRPIYSVLLQRVIERERRSAPPA
jgi:CIC family chloride channel protein